MTDTTLAPGGTDTARAAPAWFPDPVHHHELRYWDGTTWTDQVADAGAVASDPLADVAAGPSAELAAVVDRFRPRLAATSVHFRPDLPAEQLAGAIAKYAHGARPDDVLVFVDTSMRHNGKAGCVITPTTLYAHEVGSTPELPIAELVSAEVKATQVLVGGKLVVANVFGDDAPVFVELLHELGRAARGDAATPVAATRLAGSDAMPPPVLEGSAQADEPTEAGRPTIGAALGQLFVAALLGIWPILAWMTASGEDCERDGLALVCQDGNVETTFNLGIVFFLAFFALTALVRGIAMLVVALRPPES